MAGFGATMEKGSWVKIRRGLAFKMIVYVFVSIMVIFILTFHFTLKFTREIVVKNLKTNAEYLTVSTVSKIEKVCPPSSGSPIILPICSSKTVLMKQLSKECC